MPMNRVFVKFGILAVAAVLVALVLIGIDPDLSYAHTRITTDVNWSNSIQDILRRKCMSCHHPGGIAPDYVDLSVYGTDTVPGARAWAVSIEEQILTHTMPPWKADHRFSKFNNIRALTQEEKDLIIAWIRGGAPQGPRRNIPMPEEFLETNWLFGEPDMVFELPEEQVIEPDQMTHSVTVRFPIDLEEDGWITGYEFLPANPKLIHTMTAHLYDPADLENAEIELEVILPYDPLADEDELEQTRMRALPKGPHFLGQWTKGDAPVLFPDAAAKKLHAGSTIELRIEYKRPEFADPSLEIRDLSKFGLFLAQEDEEIDLLVETKTISNTEFVIEANDANAEVRTSVTFDENVHLIGLSPHLGLLAKDLEVKATYPDGKSTVLLWIPEYKYKWASSYFFDSPISAPAGTRIELAAHYDNSEDNWDNPNSPPIDVEGGDGRNNERLFARIEYMLDDHLNVQVEFVPRESTPASIRGSGMSFTDPLITAKKENDKFDLEDVLGQLREEQQIYWCPMRGNPCELRDYHDPGECEDCWMELKPKSFFLEGKSVAPDRTEWLLTNVGIESVYWCPNRGADDHELKEYLAPGVCEVDGLSLVHKAQFEFRKTYTCLTQSCLRFKDIFYGPGLCPECGQPVTGMGHMNHDPVHGGQFFMAENLYHHLEGTMPSPGEFRLYFYDDWKRPLEARNFAGTLIMEHEVEETGDFTEEEFALEIGNEGEMWFTVRLPEELPIAFFARVVLAGEEKRFDFDFDVLTIEPERTTASYIRLHTHQRTPLTIPATSGEIAEAIYARDRILAELIEKKDWFALHNPAFDAKDLVAALNENPGGLSVRQRGSLKKAVGLINRGGNGLDRAGDASDEPRVRRAYVSFAEGIALLRKIYL